MKIKLNESHFFILVIYFPALFFIFEILGTFIFFLFDIKLFFKVNLDLIIFWKVKLAVNNIEKTKKAKIR